MGKYTKKCTFQLKWLQQYSWVKQVIQDPRKAQCTMCMKTIDLSQMGESALTSHARGAKHLKNLDIKSSLTKCGLAFVRQEGTINVKTENCSRSDSNNNIVPSQSTTETVHDMTIPPPPTSSNH